VTLSTTEREEERRRGRLAGAATIAAGVFIGAGIVWGGLANRDRPDGKDQDAERLAFFDEHASELIATSALRAVGFLLLVFTIVHLHRANKARKEDLASTPLVVGLFGAIALAIGSIGQAIALGNEASDFVARDFASAQVAERAAEDAVKEGLPLATSILAFAGTIAISFWFVIASLNAMRVGLLTRFRGVLGIIVGPGFIFGFAPPVMVFWLIAVGVLFLGFWPRGLPPAWVSGEARPWPGRETTEEREEDLKLADPGGSRNGEVDAVGPGVRPAEGDESSGSAPTRRKRKRRE
jgi:hypothetical protein